MKKLFYGFVSAILASSMLYGSASALSLAPCPDDDQKAECEAQQAEILRRWEAGEPITKSVEDGQTGTGADSSTPAEVPPTFVADLDDNQQAIGLWAGKNYLLAGNNLTVNTDAKTGLLLVAGNNLRLENQSEYGFVFGNVIKFAGQTERDLYAMGNLVTLVSNAKIGRDVFVASSELRVETNLPGDLSVTADKVILKDNITIAGNLNITADEIIFGNQVKTEGKLVYNDSARVTGLDQASIAAVETFHVEEPSATAQLTAAFYTKFLSIAGLFIIMALIIAFYPALHAKIRATEDASQFGIRAAFGLGVLAIVPVVAIFALFTIVAAPLSIILFVLYFVAIYLAQGFAGLWIGHIILEKLFKTKANAYLEALLGIALLGLLALIPFVGVLTGFLGLIFGLGFMLSCVKPQAPKTDGAELEGQSQTAKLSATNAQAANTKSTNAKSANSKAVKSTKSTKPGRKTQK